MAQRPYARAAPERRTASAGKPPSASAGKTAPRLSRNRPEMSAQNSQNSPRLGARGHVSKNSTKKDKNRVDNGRHGASLLEYSVVTLLYLKTCLMSVSPPQFTGN